MTAGVRLSILAISLTLGACTAQNASIKQWPQHPFSTRGEQGDATRGEQEDAEIQYRRGNEYRYGDLQNDTEAAKWYQKAAEQGHAPAQRQLGTMYFLGEGVPQHYAEAAKWYQKAADQGYAPGQYRLGLMYSFGKGVPRNDTEAAKWTRKAADQGYAPGQSRLGELYEDGKGVPPNKVTAYAWLILAGMQFEDYRENRDDLEGKLTPDQIAAGQELAAQLHEWISARQQETEH